MSSFNLLNKTVLLLNNSFRIEPWFERITMADQPRMDTPESHTSLYSIGEMLRNTRQAQDLSVHALAERSGVSAGMISQIERGKANPSINKITILASALGLQLGVFFEPKTDDSIFRVVRKDQRHKINVPDPEFLYELLTPDLDHQLEVVWVESEPGSTTEESPFSHEGEECVVILQGTLEVHIEDETHTLNAGDSFTLLDCTVPHWYSNPGPERVISVNAITPPSF
jgi:transcriptional regulator with XRE-family HTH domain